MKYWTEGDINTGGINLHYYRIEGPNPPIVMAHGITDDGLCWTIVAKTLSEKADVFMLDARGHGKSDAPEQGYDYETLARDMAGFVNELNLERPVLFGHSMGAATVLLLAGMFPDLPRAIVLEDPPQVWKPDAQDDDHRIGLMQWMADIKRKTCAELLAEVRQENPTWPEEDTEPWVDSKQRFSLKIAEMLRQAPGASGEYAKDVKKIACPTLLITAEPARGAILSAVDVDELRVLVPHLTHKYISGAGHNIRREQLAQYLDAVQSFLSGL
jgi:pimeloyl-ACP methyl ester carboxylesterase